MPRKSKENKVDTAELIRTAADELFCERGYDAVSVRDIARRAGVAKPLVFYHYRSKAELFERVLERYYESHRSALAGAFESEGNLRVRLHRMVDAYLDFMAGNRRYAILIQQQVANPETHPLIERNLTPLYEWIRRALGELAGEGGPLGARHFFVTFSGLVINYFTYAPLLRGMWGEDPLCPDLLEERRSHVHWMVDTVLDGVERSTLGRSSAPAPTAPHADPD